MRYIKKINELVNNIDDVRIYLREFLTFLKTFDNNTNNWSIDKNEDNTSYRLSIHNIKFKHVNIPIIEEKLNDIQKNSLEFNCMVSYKISPSYGSNFIYKNKSKLDLKNNGIEYITIYIHIKNIYIKKVNVPDVIYHFTSGDNVKSIEENGLICSTNKNFTDIQYQYPPMIFATSKIDGWHRGKWLVEISTVGLKNEWWLDLNLKDEKYFMTNQDIPKEYILSIKKYY